MPIRYLLGLLFSILLVFPLVLAAQEAEPSLTDAQRAMALGLVLDHEIKKLESCRHVMHLQGESKKDAEQALSQAHLVLATSKDPEIIRSHADKIRVLHNDLSSKNSGLEPLVYAIAIIVITLVTRQLILSMKEDVETKRLTQPPSQKGDK